MKGTDSEFYLFDGEDKITKEDRQRNNLFYLYLIDTMKQIKLTLED